MRILSATLALGGFISTTVVAAGMPIQPGLWELQSTATAIDMPGAPPQMMEMMKKPRSMRHCITPEQAAKGPQEMLRQSNNGCKFTKYTMTGGQLDAVMQCSSPDRGSMTAATQGKFTPTSYMTTSKMVMTGPRGKMTMSATGTGKRLGPCK